MPAYIQRWFTAGGGGDSWDTGIVKSKQNILVLMNIYTANCIKVNCPPQS